MRTVVASGRFGGDSGAIESGSMTADRFSDYAKGNHAELESDRICSCRAGWRC
jgi:hypothetical protein